MKTASKEPTAAKTGTCNNYADNERKRANQAAKRKRGEGKACHTPGVAAPKVFSEGNNTAKHG
eukprot:712950-Amphidinium_carterae.1